MFVQRERAAVEGQRSTREVDDGAKHAIEIERRRDLATHLRDEREIASTLGGCLLARRKAGRSRDRRAGRFRQPSKDVSLGFIESAVSCERAGDAEVGGDASVDYEGHRGDGAVVFVVQCTANTGRTDGRAGELGSTLANRAATFDAVGHRDPDRATVDRNDP